MTGYFMTGTGTDVGKTFVTAGLARHLRGEGRSVQVLKPVISGFDPAAPEASDSAILLKAVGDRATLDRIAAISPWRFRAPLSPNMAAWREGRVLDFEALLFFCRQAIAGDTGTTLIEGAGGVMSPLDQERTMLDWMAALGVPVLLVAGSYLGAISHTLSALEVLQHRGLTVTAIVVSETEGRPVALDETIDAISRFAGGCKVLGVPRLTDTAGHPAFGIAAALL